MPIIKKLRCQIINPYVQTKMIAQGRCRAFKLNNMTLKHELTHLNLDTGNIERTLEILQSIDPRELKKTELKKTTKTVELI